VVINIYVRHNAALYHNSGGDSNDATAVSVWNNVAVTNRQKRHDDHPHGVEHALILTVVVAAAQSHASSQYNSL